MRSAKKRFSVPRELWAFLESGVAVIVGTRDVGMVPEITRGWGPRVLKDGRRIDLCIAFGAGRKTLENLRDNGQIALTFSLPSNYKTVQIKGSCLEIVDSRREDLAAVERHREAFARQSEMTGFPRHLSEAFWGRELTASPALVKIRFLAEQIFDQTPGPDAGSPL